VVTHTKMAVEDKLGWLFREQPTEDFGIDAHAEVVDGEEVSGRVHSLPVAVVLYDSETERCYWQLVNRDNLAPDNHGRLENSGSRSTFARR
jgi:Domain of unknown function (DUF4365)